MEYLIQRYYSFFNKVVKNVAKLSLNELHAIHSHIIITFLTSILMWSYTLFSYFFMSSNPLVFKCGLIFSSLHLLTNLLFKYTHKIFYVSSFMIFCGVCFQSVFAFHDGGVTSSALIWFGIIPLVAGIILGRVGAFVWTLVIILLAVVFITLEIFKVIPPSELSALALLVVHSILLFGFVFLSSSCIFLYLLIKEKNEFDLITQKNKFKKLVSVLLHDISGPITICKNYLMQIDKQIALDHPSHRAISKVANSINNLNEIVTSVKRMQKYQDGKIEVYLETVKFSDCIRESLVEFELILSQKNIQVQFEFEECEDLLIRVDRVLLEKQILFNILTNALKFSGENQVVYLQLSRTIHKKVRLRIIDKGFGIPENILQSLFLESNLKNPFTLEGEITSGHGLMLAKEFLDFFGGSICIESISEKVDFDNHGTIVDIYLPDFSSL